MTIKELYDWAVENDALHCELIVRDIDGHYISSYVPNKASYVSEPYWRVDLEEK